MKFFTTTTLSKFAICLLLLLPALNMQGQQVTIFNNNIINPFSVNPSQAGIGESQILFQHRKQWVGIQGAPEKSLFTSEWRLGKSKTAVGFSVSRDQANVIVNTGSYATVAQHFALRPDHQLSFGASAGVRHNSIDFARLNAHDDGDNLIFNDRQNTTNFDARFGVTYQFKELEVQASALQLFGNKAVYDNSFDQDHLEYRFVRHFVASAGYRFKIAETVGMKPMVQLRGIQGFAFQPEAIMRFDFKNQIWVAGHYRHKSSAAVTGGVAISDKYILGYSGEIATNSLAGYNGGTHEIMFGIKLGSAFKNSGKNKDVAQLKKDAKSYNERLEYLQEANRKLKEEMEAQRKKLADAKSGSPELDYTEIRKMMRDEANKALEEYEANHPPVVVASPDVTGEKDSPQDNTSEEGVRKMEHDFYVVISSVKTLNQANRTVKKARKKYDLESYVIRPATGIYYYVVTAGFNNREETRTEMIRVYKANTEKEFNGKPWVLEN